MSVLSFPLSHLLHFSLTYLMLLLLNHLLHAGITQLLLLPMHSQEFLLLSFLLFDSLCLLYQLLLVLLLALLDSLLDLRLEVIILLHQHSFLLLLLILALLFQSLLLLCTLLDLHDLFGFLFSIFNLFPCLYSVSFTILLLPFTLPS